MKEDNPKGDNSRDVIICDLTHCSSCIFTQEWTWISVSYTSMWNMSWTHTTLLTLLNWRSLPLPCGLLYLT